MFILSRNELPQTSDELALALEEAVREFASGAKPMIIVRGPDLQRLNEITVDLSGAVIDPQHRPVIPKLSRTEPAVSVHKLSISATPIKVLASDLAFHFDASNVQLHQARAADGKVLLTLHQANSGEVRVAIARDELERLIADIAAIAAAKQGVSIDNVQVDLTSHATRTLEAKVMVTVRKLFFRTSLRLFGTVTVTDDLEATVSGLRCEGDGTLAALVCAAITPHFSRMEERAFPLSALPMGEVRVNDLAVTVDDKQIVVAARFGSQSAKPN
jgi:hypothetical protein